MIRTFNLSFWQLVVVVSVVVSIVAVFWIAILDSRQPLDQKDYKTQSLKNIPPLADCIYINLDGLRIIRCPNSTTSTDWTTTNGKATSTHDAVVISQ